MSEFKIGELVRVTGNCGKNDEGVRHYYEDGTIVTVKEGRDYYGDYLLAGVDHVGNQFVNEHNLERVPFQPGDKVIVRANSRLQAFDSKETRAVVTGLDQVTDDQFDVEARRVVQGFDGDGDEYEQIVMVADLTDLPTFERGDTVRIIGNGNDDDDDRIGHAFANGDLVEVRDGPDSDGDYLVMGEEMTQYVNEVDLELYEAEDEGLGGTRMSEFWAGQRVRVSEDATRHYSDDNSTTPSRFAGQVVTVDKDGTDPDGDVVLRNDDGQVGWAMPQFLTPVGDEQPQVTNFQPGDRVRVTDIGGNPVEVGDTGTVISAHDYDLDLGAALITVRWDKGGEFGLFGSRLEKIDVVNNPPHYKFSNGAEVIDITENLTSNGGQAVQYIARSTRLDGNNKGDVLEDLRKARWFIDREIARIEQEG